MMELTKERLMALSNRENVGAICSDEIVEMARQLLAGLEQEPVAEVYQPANIGICAPLGPSVMMLKPLSAGTKLYAAPQLPQPAVPECYQRLLKHAYGMTMGHDWNKGTMAGHHREKLCKAVEDCRAAMLQGAEPVQVWIPCSERIPEGSEEVLCAKEFDGPDDWRKKVGYWLAGKWTVYGASWTPTHWMPLPAAPQQEVKP